MSKTWFTSDTHFGHTNIIKYCARPFADVGGMDETIIANWNAVVGPEDAVYHLGDFAFRGVRSPEDYLSRLSGRKHLIYGNHDSEQARETSGWTTSQQMAEVTVDGARLVLLHYAMRVWSRSHNGSLHLFGHSHGTLPGDRQSCDVGVDSWDFRPVSLTEIRRKLVTFPERGTTSATIR